MNFSDAGAGAGAEFGSPFYFTYVACFGSVLDSPACMTGRIASVIEAIIQWNPSIPLYFRKKEEENQGHQSKSGISPTVLLRLCFL